MTDPVEGELLERLAAVLAGYVAEGFDVGAIAVASADAAASFAGFMIAGSDKLSDAEGVAEGLSAIYAGQLRISFMRAFQRRAKEDGS